jgi:peptide deformylase
MTARRVLHWPDQNLKKIAVKVKKIDDAVISLAKDLRDTMRVEMGAGLASTQIGETLSAVVIEGRYSEKSTVPHDPVLKDVIVMINPEIEVIDDQTFEWEEACLSVPDYSERVVRNKNIRLTYKNLSGEDVSKNLTSDFSGIVQHEVDHLVGCLYLDRLTKSRQKKAVSALMSRIKKKKEALKKQRERLKRESQPDKPEPRNGFRTKPTRIRMKSSKKKKTSHRKKRG